MIALRSTWPKRTGIAVVIALFVAVASAYSVVMPLGEAPDEVSHYSYARYIAREGRLPPPEGPASGEAFQPPLYYALGAAISAWIPEGQFTVKGNSDYSLAVVDSVPNTLLHTSQEAFPYRDGALAWHLIRLMSVAMGAVTVWATYGLARRVFSASPGLAAAAAAFVAFLPEFLFISGSVNNDNLATMISSLTLLQIARLWRTEPETAGDGYAAPGHTAAGSVGGWLALGLLLGLGFWTKISLLVFWPLAGLAVLRAAARARQTRAYSIRAALVAGTLTFGSSVLIALPLAVRNALALGDPLGWALMRRVTEAVAGPLTREDYASWLMQLFQSFWGRFGGAAHVQMHPLVYAGLALVSAAALVGFAGFLWRIREARASGDPGAPVERGLVAMLGLHCLLMALLLWQWAHTNQGTGQARLAYPALPVIGLFFVTGLAETGDWSASWRRGAFVRWSRGGGTASVWWRPLVDLPRIVACGLLLLSVTTLFGFLLPLYHMPPRISPDGVPSSSRRGPFVFGSGIRLIGWELNERSLAPGAATYVTLYWQVAAAPRDDYWLLLRLQGEGERTVWDKDGSPSAGRDSTDTWRAGDIMAARHRIALPSQTPLGTYRLLAGLHRFGTWDWLMIRDDAGKALGDTIALGEITIAAR
jgi:4-amino-4-deoxy-L-arabinose transferase-like glycosyltransferase